jgi:hypothetical protein
MLTLIAMRISFVGSTKRWPEIELSGRGPDLSRTFVVQRDLRRGKEGLFLERSGRPEVRCRVERNELGLDLASLNPELALPSDRGKFCLYF